MIELITMGETMVAMLPQQYGLLRYESNYTTKTAGAESNVAIGLSKLGHSAGWISKVGNDEFGRFIIRNLQADGVDCSNVIFDSEHNTGMMFKQIYGEDTSVFYYRQNSAASFFRPEDINEEYIKQAKILHLTGITPVLSEDCADTVDALIDIAKKNNVKFSFDPNVRKKLWKDKDYSERLKEILLKADIVELGVEEAECLIGLSNPDEIMRYILDNNKDAVIAIKNGSKGAIVADKNNKHIIEPCKCKCIESIGAGDAFNAGFLSGILENQDLLVCGRMGAIAGAMATEVRGDVEGQPDKIQMSRKLNNSNELYR